MLHLLLLLAAEAPLISATEGRVLVVDARRAEFCAPGATLQGAQEGVLELGAASRASLRVPGRMSLACSGPASCTWSAGGLQLSRAGAAVWEWRGEAQDLRLWDGLVLQGGPGAYELRVDARGLELAVQAGAPLELRQEARLVARASAGASVRVGREAWSAAPSTAPARNTRERSCATAPVSRALDSAPTVDLWRPAQWSCSASVRPPVFQALPEEPEPAPAAEAPLPQAKASPCGAVSGSAVELAPESATGGPLAQPAPVAAQVQLPTVLEPRASPVATAPAIQLPRQVRWPSWFARPAVLFARRLERWREACTGLAARYQAQQAFGVRFDPFAPFQVDLKGDRLSLLLDPGAARAEQVRGRSLLLVPPGAAVVLVRGGGLESYAGQVVVRPLRHR